MKRMGWLWLMALLACTKAQPHMAPAPEPSSPPVAVTSPASPPPPQASDTGETPAPPGSPAEDPCGAIRAEFDAAKAAAPRTCASAAGCECYSSLQFDNTLEVADKASAMKLQSLSDRYRQRMCPTVSVSVATPPQCRPRCEAKRCK